MSWLSHVLQRQRPNFTTPPARAFRYPESEDEWKARYDWLFAQYIGEAYTLSDMTALGLFRAVDSDGDTIAETRRLTRDVQHIVNTDVRAMASAKHSLEPTRGSTEARVRAGEAIWRRGAWQAHKANAARLCASLGDVYLEAQRSEGGGPARIVIHDARHVRPRYDNAGLHLEGATIRVPYFDHDGTLRVELRELDATSIRAQEIDPRAPDDIRVIGGQSGDHGLGVVPLVHIPFERYGPPEHGLWAGHAMEQVLGHVDSAMAQVKAIAHRYGNPIMALFGASLASESDIQKFGRIIANLPPEARLEYVEAGLAAIQAIWQATREYKEDVRDTIPEFLFSGAGANTSGKALDLRANEFKGKMVEVRGTWFDAIERVTQYGVLLDDGGAYDPDDHWYRIGAPPILPIDVGERINHVVTLRTNGLISDEDAVRQVQAVGFIDETQDPAEYAANLAAERAARAPDMAPDDDETDSPDEGGEEEPDEQEDV